MDVGKFNDWQDANGVAVAYEWEDDHGIWRKQYLESMARWSLVDQSVPGTFPGYVTAMAVRRFFLQESIDQKKMWEIDIGVATVKEAKYHHATQEIRITDRASTTRTVVPFHALTGQQMGAKLLALGISQYGTEPGIILPGERAVGQGGKRLKCDTCAFYYRGGVCNAVKDQTKRCSMCEKVGRDCTWTGQAKLMGNRAFRNALYMRASIEERTFVMDPQPELTAFKPAVTE